MSVDRDTNGSSGQLGIIPRHNAIAVIIIKKQGIMLSFERIHSILPRLNATTVYRRMSPFGGQ